jgi:hypothetical protein
MSIRPTSIRDVPSEVSIALKPRFVVTLALAPVSRACRQICQFPVRLAHADQVVGKIANIDLSLPTTLEQQKPVIHAVTVYIY